MPPKKKGKKKPNNKTKKRQQKGSEGEKTSEKSFSLSAPLKLPPGSSFNKCSYICFITNITNNNIEKC